MGGCGGHKRTALSQFLLWEGVVGVMKKLVLVTISTFNGCGHLEKTQFQQFLLWVAVVVMKELLFNSFYFWWVGGKGRTDF